MSEEDLSDDWFERALEERRVSEREESDESPPDEGPDAETTDSEAETSGPARPREDADGPTAAPNEAGGSDPLFDQGFDDALSEVDAPTAGDAGAGPEGFGDVDFGLESDEPDFDEDLETSIPRIELGIEGLDQMI